MKQIYDGCWAQQIKLTVMYGGLMPRWSHSTTTGRSFLLYSLVRKPHNEIPLTDFVYVSFFFLPPSLILSFLLFSLSFFLLVTFDPRLIRTPANCPWRMLSPLTTTGWFVLPCPKFQLLYVSWAGGHRVVVKVQNWPLKTRRLFSLFFH